MFRVSGVSKAFLAAALSIGIAACSAPESVREDGVGAAQVGPEMAQAFPTFVSLNPCTDAILVEVADPEQILALSHYSRDPSGSSMDTAVAREFGVTGGTAEEVFALDPDIVLASSFMQPASRAALDDLGFAVESFGITSTPEDSFAQIEQIAVLAGHPERGKALIERIESALAQTAPREGTPQVSALMWQSGQIVPGETTLISHLLDTAGFTSDSKRRGLGQADFVSLERVIIDPPDVLLVAGNSSGQSHPMLERLERMQVETFDANLLYCGGPTIIRAAERLSEIRQRALGETAG